MRRNFAIIGIVLLFAFVGCKSETHVEESTTVQQPLATGPETPPPSVPPAFDLTQTTTTDTAFTTTETGATTTAAKASALPKTHTVDFGGSMHAPGAKENPTQKCGACHGRDLKGGKTAPSCFDCHEQKW